jgi:hypothetical protein
MPCKTQPNHRPYTHARICKKKTTIISNIKHKKTKQKHCIVTEHSPLLLHRRPEASVTA